MSNGPLAMVCVATLLMAAACAPEPQVARYTVDQYRANAALRRAQVARCEADPGTLADTPDCINARQAAAFEDHPRVRDLPPLGLDPNQNPIRKRTSPHKERS